MFQEIAATFRIIKFANIIRDFPAFSHDKVIHTWDKTTTLKRNMIAGVTRGTNRIIVPTSPGCDCYVFGSQDVINHKCLLAFGWYKGTNIRVTFVINEAPSGINRYKVIGLKEILEVTEITRRFNDINLEVTATNTRRVHLAIGIDTT